LFSFSGSRIAAWDKKKKLSRTRRFFQVAQVVENWNPLVLELKQWAVFGADMRQSAVCAVL